MQDWIVWNRKDKYRQAGSRVGSPGDGVDNACCCARPEVRSLETVVSGECWWRQWSGKDGRCAARTATSRTGLRIPAAPLCPAVPGFRRQQPRSGIKADIRLMTDPVAARHMHADWRPGCVAPLAGPCAAPIGPPGPSKDVRARGNHVRRHCALWPAMPCHAPGIPPPTLLPRVHPCTFAVPV